MELEILNLFGEILRNVESSPQMQMLVLEALTSMCSVLQSNSENFDKFIDKLFSTGIVTEVEKLQHHKNNDVYQKAYHLISTYLQIETYV